MVGDFKQLILAILFVPAIAFSQGGQTTKVRTYSTAAALAAVPCEPTDGSIAFVATGGTNIGLWECFAHNTWVQIFSAGGGGGGVSQSGGVAGYIPKWGVVPNLVNSLADDSVTTANTLTYSGTNGIAAPSYTAFGPGQASVTIGTGAATTSSFLRVYSGDAASNAEPAYIQMGASPASTYFSYLYPCDNGGASGGHFCQSAAVPAADSGNWLEAAMDIQNNSAIYAADTGAADAYTVTVTPTPALYAAGQCFYFVAENANTGASTLSINGQLAKDLVKQGGTALVAGDIIAAHTYQACYNGVNFDLVNSGVPSLSGDGLIRNAEDGVGDGLDAIAAGTYPKRSGFSDFTGTLTVTGASCWTDSGTSTCDIQACHIVTGAESCATILTGVITGTTIWAAGSLSGTPTLPTGYWLKYIFVCDGTTKQITAHVKAHL